MSILETDPPFGRGNTLGVSSVNDGKTWIGAGKVFLDCDPKTGVNYSNAPVHCVILRNRTGSALLPGTIVARTIDSATAISAGTTAFTAVVDEYLPATGVAVNDCFYGVLSGPCSILTAGTLAVGDVVKSGAAGKAAAGVGLGFTLSAVAAGKVRCLIGSGLTADDGVAAVGASAQ